MALVPDCLRTCSTTADLPSTRAIGLDLGHAVLDPGDVAHPDRIAGARPRPGCRRTPRPCPRGRRCAASGRAAPARPCRRGSGCSAPAARAPGRRRQAVRGQLGGVDDDVDLARPPADDAHLADAGDRLELAPERLVDVLGDVALRAGPDTAMRDDRRGVGIDLLDRSAARRRGAARDEHRVHLVAHFLRRDVAVLLQVELDHDHRDVLGREGDQLVDAADGVDRLLDLVGDLGLDLLRRRRRAARWSR